MPGESAARRLVASYRLLGRALAPVAPLILEGRARRGKEDRARLGERFGRASRPRPGGPLVWIHAASVGETMAVLPLVHRLAASGPAALMTTGTVTSASLAAERLPEGVPHQFAPLDLAPCLDRFLDHWRPDLALFVESEIWPGIVSALSARGVPQILVNARMSERSFRRWSHVPGLSRALFGRLSLALAQSGADAERFAGLGVARVGVSGNLKYDGSPLPADPEALARMRTWIAGRPVWLAASTHPGEERAVFAAHCRLQAAFPGLLALIVPRHPERGPAIAEELSAQGARVALRSLGQPVAPDTGIYVADTIGELGLFYRLSGIAFLGGSLVPHGGQNPIEAIRLGCAVTHGPHIGNFHEIYGALDERGGAVAIADGAGRDDGAVRAHWNRVSLALNGRPDSRISAGGPSRTCGSMRVDSSLAPCDAEEGSHGGGSDFGRTWNPSPPPRCAGSPSPAADRDGGGTRPFMRFARMTAADRGEREGAASLAAAVAHFLTDEAARDRAARRAAQIVAERSGALDRTVSALQPFLDPLRRAPAEAETP